MRKMMIGTVMMCAIALLVGCSSQTAKENPKVEKEIIASFTAGHTEKLMEILESSEALDVKENESITTTTEQTKPKEESKKQEVVQASTQKNQANTQKVTSPAKEEIKTSEPVVSNPLPQVTEPPVESTTEKIPEQPTEPTPEVVPEQPKAESFDVSPYVSYAKSYAQSLGLTTDVAATECWDNPISANARKTNINGDIESRLNRYVREGCEGVWIWSVKESETEYLIYIGYY